MRRKQIFNLVFLVSFLSTSLVLATNTHNYLHNHDPNSDLGEIFFYYARQLDLQADNQSKMLALDYYGKAVLLGHAPSLNNLAGKLAMHGQIDEAIEYLQKAAEQDDICAHFNLANLLLLSDEPEYYTSALHHFQRAANLGFLPALYNLSMMHKHEISPKKLIGGTQKYPSNLKEKELIFHTYNINNWKNSLNRKFFIHNQCKYNSSFADTHRHVEAPTPLTSYLGEDEITDEVSNNKDLTRKASATDFQSSPAKKPRYSKKNWHQAHKDLTQNTFESDSDYNPSATSAQCDTEASTLPSDKLSENEITTDLQSPPAKKRRYWTRDQHEAYLKAIMDIHDQTPLTVYDYIKKGKNIDFVGVALAMNMEKDKTQVRTHHDKFRKKLFREDSFKVRTITAIVVQ